MVSPSRMLTTAFLRRTAVALNTQPSTLNTFGYDNASRLSSVANGLNTAAYTYLANSPLVSQILFKTNGNTRMTTTKTVRSPESAPVDLLGAECIGRIAGHVQLHLQQRQSTNATHGIRCFLLGLSIRFVGPGDFGQEVLE